MAVCAAGLAAGPWVELAIGVFVTWLAVAHYRLPLIPELLGHFSESEEIETAGESFFIVFTQACL